MQLNKSNMKKIALLIAFAIGLYWLLHNTQTLLGATMFIWTILQPFVFGLVAAFLLNIPMRAIEKHLFRGRGGRLRRPLSFVLTIVLVLGVITFVVATVIPQLVSTLILLGKSTPGYVRQLQKMLQPLEEYLPSLQTFLGSLDVNSVGAKIFDFLQSGFGGLFSSAVGLASSVVSGAFSFFIGIIFSAYVLLDKEHLSAQLKGLMKAYLPDKWYNRILRYTAITSLTFSRFVSGQCIECVLVGVIYFLILTVGGFKYALLIGVLIGFLSLIPIVGATIACVVGALLLLMAQGWVRALVFVAIYVVVQQLEGNLLYPHVVGTSVGLPPIWVLVAVMVGGGLFGLFGMLFCIPLASVIYTLLHKDALRRLHEKGEVSPVRALDDENLPRKKRRKSKDEPS